MVNLSICLITKNESNIIEKCLDAIIKSFSNININYELSVTDTGSTDNTIEIAKSYNCSISTFEWINDFSAARNYAMARAKYDYILFVDADEILESADWVSTLSLLKQYPKYVGRFTRHSLCNSENTKVISTDHVERLFNRKYYHYELSIHEQLTSNDHNDLTVYDIPLSFFHEGYNGSFEQLKQKAQRNNELLFKELEKTPNDPYLYYQIGQSYGLISDYNQQLSYYQKAYSYKPDMKNAYVPDLVVALGHSYMKQKMYDKALTLFNENKQELSFYADFLCMGAYALIKTDHLCNAIIYCNKALELTTYSLEGANSYIPYYYLGCIYDAFDNFELAQKYYELSDNYSDSATKLSDLLTRKNTYDFTQKKLSIIFYVNQNTDYNDTMKRLLKQTLSISQIELLFVGNIAINEELNCIEKEYPNSVMLINTPDIENIEDAVNIALEYISGKYVLLGNCLKLLYVDGLRHILEASSTEFCEIGACNVNYGDENDFYITIHSYEEAKLIYDTNLLSTSYYNKIFSADYIRKNNLNYMSLLSFDALCKAKHIYCCKNELL